LAAWIIFTPFKTDSPILELSRDNAVEVAKTKLTEKYDLNFEEWTILTSVEDKVDIRDIFVWQEGNEELYNQLLDKFLAPPYWKVRLVKTKGKAEEKTEEFIVQILNDKSILGVTHKIPENANGRNLEKETVQLITDSVLSNYFSLDRKRLKEISISPTKQENRTDWEFIYADTTNFPLNQGQGRYLINISGDEVTSFYSYLHIPEDWMRNRKEEVSKKSILKTIGNILVIGAIIFGLVMGIIRWTRKKFKLKVFVVISILFALFFCLEIGLGWQNLLSGYSTQIPMSNFLTTVIIGLSISGIFFSLFNGIIVAATPGWLPTSSESEKFNFLKSVGLGFFIAGVLAAVQNIIPKTEPSWLSYSYLNGSAPFAAIGFSNIMGIITYPAFASMLFLGIHYFTKNWTSQKWTGFVFALLAGFSVMALSFENFPAWMLSGAILSGIIILIYIFFIRFHFEWIPITFGIIPVMKMIKEMLIIKNPAIIAGGLLMIIISLLLLFWWYKLLKEYSFQKR